MDIINIQNLFKLSDSEIKNNILNYLHKSNKLLNYFIKEKKENILKFLKLDTYNFNIYNSFIGYKLLTTDDTEFWRMLDNKMNEYNNYIFSSKKLYSILLNVGKDDNLDNESKIFILKIINNMKKNGVTQNNTNILKIKNLIDKNKSIIEEKLLTNDYINIDKKTIFPNIDNNSKIKVKLDHSNYFYLLNNINDSKKRKKIEDIYNSNLKNCIEEISKILILRYKYSNLLGYNSYFNYINDTNNDNSEVIKSFINNLLNKINEKSYIEIQKIKQDLGKNNIEDSINNNDLIYYHNNLSCKVLFKPKNILNIIFAIFKEYFDINFIPINLYKWNNNIQVYLCTNFSNGKKLGIIYLDLIESQSKKVDCPFFMKLSDRYNLNKSTELVYLSIISNYKNFDEECINYNQCILLFKEFGHVLKNVSYKSNVGLINYEEEFIDFLPQIMEYFALDNDTIKKICNNNDENYQHIIFSKNIDKCFKLKQKCVNATFDHIIHNSPDIIKILIDSVKEKKDNPVLINLYKELNIDIMNNCSNLINTDIDYIPYNVIISLINGSQGKIYGSILSDVLAFNTFLQIKNGYGNEFRKEVLEDITQSFKLLLNKFIDKFNVNEINLYTNYLLNKENINNNSEDENNDCEDSPTNQLSEGTNFFDEKNTEDYNDDADKEEVIIYE